MTITDPEVLKRVAEQKAARKAEYEAQKGKPQGQSVLIQKCKKCGAVIGMFGATIRFIKAVDEKGRIFKVPVHVNCPGKP